MGSGSSTCEKDTQDKSDISKSKNESVVTNTCNVDSSSTCEKDTQDKPDISKSKNGAVVGNKTGARGSRDTTKFPQKRKSKQPKVNV